MHLCGSWKPALTEVRLGYIYITVPSLPSNNLLVQRILRLNNEELNLALIKEFNKQEV